MLSLISSPQKNISGTNQVFLLPSSVDSTSSSQVASEVFKPEPPKNLSICNLVEDVKVHLIYPCLDLRSLSIFVESMSGISTLTNSIWKTVGTRFGLSYAEIEAGLKINISAEHYVNQHLQKLLDREKTRRHKFIRIHEILKKIEAAPKNIWLYEELRDHAEALNYRIFFNQLTDNPIDLNSDKETLRNTNLFLKSEISEITTLKLSNKFLTQLPIEIGLFKNLVKLDLSSNYLTELPSLSTCKDLKHLNCSKNRLLFLPDLSDHTELDYFDCSDNQLETFSKFADLKKLKYFFFCNNPFSKLSDLDIQSLGQLLKNSSSFEYNEIIWKALRHKFGIELCKFETLSAREYVKEQCLQLYVLEKKRSRYFAAIADLTESIEKKPDSVGLYIELKVASEAINYFLFFKDICDDFQEISDIETLKKRVALFKKEVTAEKFLHIAELNLSGKRMSSLPAEVYLFKNLKHLNLSYNCLTELPDLSCCSLLEHLNLSHNELTNILGISHCNKITYLNCANNKINVFPNLINLTSLTKLICGVNQLSSLPDLSHMTGLKEIVCSFNQLTTLSGINKLRELEEFYCSHNSLTHLSELSELTNLKTLDCSENKLTSLSDLTILTKIISLDCSNNRIKSILEVLNFSALEYFFCSNNIITELPELTNLYLQTFGCAHNQLERLPDFNKLTRLTYFDCSHNQLTQLPTLNLNVKTYI